MTSNNLDEFFCELRRHVEGDLRTDDYHRMFYSTDASLYQVMPLGVFFPRHADEVQATVEVAAQYGVPLLPRAGGSSLAGQSVNEALIMDTSHHLDQLLEINPEERWVRVQPGLILDDLNAQLQPHGLQFGPDPASSNRAGMGGIVGNNATGSHSIVYGMTVDHVLAAEVILSDGSPVTFAPVNRMSLTNKLQQQGLEGDLYRKLYDLSQNKAEVIRQGTPRHWRRCGGYNLSRFVEKDNASPYPRADGGQFNLAQLICGSEGTLGVMTEMTLNLVPRPSMTALAIVHFSDAYTALDTTQTILQTDPSAVELLDQTSLNLTRTVPAFAKLLESFIDGQPNSVLITEYYGETKAELQHKIDSLRQLLHRKQISHTGIVPLLKPEQQAKVWQVRKAGLGLLMSKRGDYKPITFIEDSAVPVAHLADYITALKQFCRELGTTMAYYAHASGGCLHIRPLINIKEAAEIAKLPLISQFALDLIAQYGGTWSSEHGDGRARSWLNERFFGPALFDLFREVKQTFDPDNIFNPGNIVDGPPMTEHLRYGAAYETINLTEQLDFSSDHGFARAVEMCNGSGVCRKLTSGTMCPSYMVTKEEEHSTRGRANALRAALSGTLPATEFTSKRMYQVLDLCLSCKACKTECPTSVDMAKIKFEFLTHYYERHGTPWRARLFGDINFLSHLSSGFPAPLINFLSDLPPVKLAMAKLLGIHPERTLPKFAFEPFTRWFKRKHQPPADFADRPRVVLFNDTFNTFNYPWVAQAATTVLEAAGFAVLLPGHRCCGRPMISKGLLKQAQRAAMETVAALAPFATQGIPIVGLEPSCLLSLRDEYAVLLPHDDRVSMVAQHSYLFEEFIAKLVAEGRLDLQFTRAARQVLLHGHCHQKSLVGTQPSKQVLSLPPNYSVAEVDSGCCGMAGSFGYEAEHYEISMAMAERRLWPAVRQQPAETIIAAAGVSCREQIAHGTGRQAQHPAEVLFYALSSHSD